MKIGALALVAVLTVAGCSSLSNSLNHFVDPTPSASPTPSCYQQFKKWQHPPHREGLVHKINVLTKATSAEAEAGNLAAYLHALHKLGRTLGKVPPMPYCADPRGYLTRIIAKVNAAADNAQSASLDGLRQALAPLLQMRPLIKKLIHELDRRVHPPSHMPGVGSCGGGPLADPSPHLARCRRNGVSP